MSPIDLISYPAIHIDSIYRRSTKKVKKVPTRNGKEKQEIVGGGAVIELIAARRRRTRDDFAYHSFRAFVNH